MQNIEEPFILDNPIKFDFPSKHQMCVDISVESSPMYYVLDGPQYKKYKCACGTRYTKLQSLLAHYDKKHVLHETTRRFIHSDVYRCAIIGCVKSYKHKFSLD